MRSDGNKGAKEPLPFYKWKAEQYTKDQAAGTPRGKERYYRDYGTYCNQVRKGKA